MKYMGSKRYMLENGLGKILLKEAQNANRFVDLFAGAGFVSWFVAENSATPVWGIDLQKYSTVLVEAIISRDYIIDEKPLIKKWLKKSIETRNFNPIWKEINRDIDVSLLNKDTVHKSRELCKKTDTSGVIFKAYGGYYFSPQQAFTIDYLLNNLPKDLVTRSLCLASLISAASECVAAPGHTAQPFQPTDKSIKFIFDSWRRDICVYSEKNLSVLSSKHAKSLGKVTTGDALSIINSLNSNDLIFIDPPYSNVQYSRFYHVLETIARNEQVMDIFGKGRYPHIKKRPQSDFSNVGKAQKALSNLINGIAKKRCKVILTFPRGKTSNGLSGDFIKTIAEENFYVNLLDPIKGKFSTLGGNNNHRAARQKSNEAIFIMYPKKKYF